VPDCRRTNSVDPRNSVASELGRIKTFRPVGPPYKVGEPLHQPEDGDWLVQVTMVQIGELAEYRLSRVVGDPDAV
jgi:Family of unknown function (DUF5397)